MKEKVLTQENLGILADLVLRELGNIREFSNAHGEAVRKALETEIGKLHTLYNYLIE